MIDSLLFLTDDIDVAVLDATPAAGAPVGSPADVQAADVQAAAASAATRDGHAHAARRAWAEALVALEHSAALRDALDAAGHAGPAVAVRGWCDVATVRLAAGDLAGARGAFVRARIARRHAHELPADLTAALAELDAELAPGGAHAPSPAATAAAPDDAEFADATAAGGLLWLDTTEDDGEVELVAEAEASGPAEAAAPAGRIAAVDQAVALAQPLQAARMGWVARLRRLFGR